MYNRNADFSYKVDAMRRSKPEPSPVALVTGGAKRIGRAIALALAEDGFDVALHYNTSRDEAETLQSDIERMGRRAVAVAGDLAKPDQAPSLVEAVRDALGPLSLLVNNASVLDRDCLDDMTMESWRHLVDVNLTSPVFLMQVFAGQKELPKGASIINLLDQQMSSPSPRFFSYSVAKIGFEGATRLAAFELAPDIRVNGIAPGPVLASWMQSDEAHRRRQQKMPLGEGLGTDDIVHAVRYLLGAPHVTGEVLVVDSGQKLIGPGNSRLLPRRGVTAS